MIPLYDSVRRSRRPYMNYALLAANLAVFLGVAWLPDDGARLIQVLAVKPVLIYDVGTLVRAGFWPLATLVTATFMHGGWLHLFGNLIYLWVFGDNVEDWLGPARYLLFYAAGGATAGLAHVLANPAATVPAIGASGAVAAVLGAYVVLHPRARVLTLVPFGFLVAAVRLPAWLYLGSWLALQLWAGLGSGVGGSQNIAWWAHIGGFLAGMGLVRLLQQPKPAGEMPT